MNVSKSKMPLAGCWELEMWELREDWTIGMVIVGSGRIRRPWCLLICELSELSEGRVFPHFT